MKKMMVSLALLTCSQLISNDINWSTNPVNLSSTSQNASDAYIGVASSGMAVAVWLENGLVKAKTRVSGVWNNATTLSNPSASSPRLVVDPNGNASAVWLESGVVKSSSKPAAGSWSATTSLSSSGSSSPQIAVDSNGNLGVVWIRSTKIEAKTKAFGGSWSAVSAISTVGSDSPQIAIGNGNVVTVWHDTVNGVDTIFSASKPIAGNWGSALTVSNANQHSVKPQIAVDKNGNAMAIWYRFDLSGLNYSNVIVQSAYLPLNGSWVAPVDISAAGMSNPNNLVAKVAFDVNGNAVALWNQSFDGSSFSVQASQKKYTKPWSQPIDLVNSNVFAYDLDLAVNSIGDALASYMFYDGSFSIIQSKDSSTTGVGTDWSVPINLSRGNANAFPRVVTAVGTDNIYADVVWIQYNGSHNIVQTTSGLGSIVQPPTNLSVVQGSDNQGVFNEYYNVFTWEPGVSDDIVAYLIYRNGVLIDQVDATTLLFRDDNRAQNGPAIYGISALDQFGSQSRIVSVSFP